jgi:hypothetical protein
VLAHDAITDPKPEAGPLADALGGEERLEYVTDVISVDSRTVVGDLDDDLIAVALG